VRRRVGAHGPSYCAAARGERERETVTLARAVWGGPASRERIERLDLDLNVEVRRRLWSKIFFAVVNHWEGDM
jgi:hypothetical protein